MKKQNRYPLGKKIKYLLDDFISKGFFAQILLLLAISVTFTLLSGLITIGLGQPNFQEGYWLSLIHMLDPGTIASNQSGSNTFFIYMLIVTIVGMVFTSTIVAIINNAIQGKLDELKKGHSAIIETNHVVIFGFDANACMISHEILESSRKNNEHMCLVVADDLSKEAMEHAMREYRENPRHYLENSNRKNKPEKGTKIIIRSGDLISENTFTICAAERAKAIIINRENDMETIRILLALVPYLKKKHAYLEDVRMPAIVAMIHDSANLTTAYTAAELDLNSDTLPKNQHMIRILNDKISMGLMIAQACIHPGLPYVLDGLFNYMGSSIRIEKQHETENRLTGKNLRQIAAMTTNAIPLGFAGKRGNDAAAVTMNPGASECSQPEDRLIYLSETSTLLLGNRKPISPKGVPIQEKAEAKLSRRNFLFIGQSEALPEILNHVKRFCNEHSTAVIYSAEDWKAPDCGLECLRIATPDSHRWEAVEQLFLEHPDWFDASNSHALTNIVIFSQGSENKPAADEKLIVLLLNIRRYLKDHKAEGINLISEIHLPQNRRLVQCGQENDYVISSEIANRMMTQIMEDPWKYAIIRHLLLPGNSTIGLHPLSDYVDTTQCFNFECVFRSASERQSRNEKPVIPLGWICFERSVNDENSQTAGLVLNPSAEELAEVHDGGDYSKYRLVVLSDIGRD